MTNRGQEVDGERYFEIGRHSGGNIEIRENAGEENFFLFGLDANEVKVVQKVIGTARVF